MIDRTEHPHIRDAMRSHDPDAEGRAWGVHYRAWVSQWGNGSTSVHAVLQDTETGEYQTRTVRRSHRRRQARETPIHCLDSLGDLLPYLRRRALMRVGDVTPVANVQDAIRTALDHRMEAEARERAAQREAARSRAAHTVERWNGKHINVINE